VPEVEDLDDPLGFRHTVIDHYRRVDQLAYTGPANDSAANVRKPLQNVQMFQKNSAEMLGSAREIDPGISHDFLKVG
jgi:hypothetical protein